MARLSEFSTKDLELAAALMASGIRPKLIAPSKDLVEFHFANDDNVQSIALQYAAGTLLLEVRRLACNRTWLFRQVREVARTGREVRL
jgi:hypothetical protein